MLSTSAEKPLQGRADPRVSLDAAARRLQITWPDGRVDGFHYAWLRHAGLCPGGMPNDTVNKLELLPDDPARLAVESFDLRGGLLKLNWADDRVVTTHALTDLQAGAYGSERRVVRKRQPILWDTETTADLPCFDASVLNQPEGLLAVHLAVRDYGLARLTSVPAEPGQVAEVAGHFGPLFVSNYGGVFDVRTNSDLALGANTASFLGPHTDENYRHAPPGISFFHCLRASSGGGESLLVDGFNAARRLREGDPGSYAVLCRTPVLFRRFAPPDDDMRARGRIIVTDIDGALEGIRFTDRTIPPQDLPADLVEPFYRGLKAFWNLVNDPQAQFRYLMRPGDLHIFDNQRVLHGRTAFDPAAGPRHLQQCAVARDEFHNRLRLLAASLGHPAAGADMAGGALG